jgi:hypothetical protein
MTTTFHSVPVHFNAAIPTLPVSPVPSEKSARLRARLGERQTRDWIDYGRPDVGGTHLRRLKRARIAVVGDGENVDKVLVDLDALARLKPGTVVTHVSPRRASHCMTTASRVEGFRVHGFYPTEGGVMLEGDDGRWIGPFDRLIVDDANDAA